MHTRNLLVVGYTIMRRPAGHEHPRPALSEHACEPTANAEVVTQGTPLATGRMDVPLFNRGALYLGFAEGSGFDPLAQRPRV